MATPLVDKLIVTDTERLATKYSTAADVLAAVAAMVTADAARGVTAELVDLSDVDLIATFDLPARGEWGDPAWTVATVDAIADVVAPDYLVLLGGPDVVPMIPVQNPLGGGTDPDVTVPSDLPYACSGPFQFAPADLVGPTRVVGRIPDGVGATDAAPLIAALDTAASWTSRPAADYRRHLSVSAEVWQASTTQSVEKTFGDTAVRRSPAEGPDWGTDGSRLTHFFNLHGVTADHRFYGEGDTGFPVAHASDVFAGAVAPGTVVAAECCNGAELWDPVVTGGHLPLPLRYLSEGAYAFVGATTIAYGAAIGSAAADMICHFFLDALLGGASTGRSMLEARQRYVRENPVMTPTDLKTLAQFVLLGDPSVHPVERVDADVAIGAVRPATRTGSGRSQRRRNLEVQGKALSDTTLTAGEEATDVGIAVGSRVVQAGTDAARDVGGRNAPLADVEVRAFRVREPEVVEVMHPAGAPPAETTMHLLMGRSTDDRAGDGVGSGVSTIVVVVAATTDDGEVVSTRTLLAR